MANTYHKIFLQSIFAVKYRASVIKPEWQKKFFGVIGNLINETGCSTIIVNGVEDHVHCFFGLHPSLAVADVMQKVKSISSGWLNKQNFMRHHFEWQSGYGASSYSSTQVSKVYEYILNQEKHHEKKSFREEYMELLKKFSITFDEKYLFHELI